MAGLSADTETTFPPLMKCLFVGSSVSFLLIVDYSTNDSNVLSKFCLFSKDNEHDIFQFPQRYFTQIKSMKLFLFVKKYSFTELKTSDQILKTGMCEIRLQKSKIYDFWQKSWWPGIENFALL